MHKIETEFRKISDQEPLLSSIMVFIKSVRYKHHTEETVRKMFDKLVEEADYDKRGKEHILKWLSNML